MGPPAGEGDEDQPTQFLAGASEPILAVAFSSDGSRVAASERQPSSARVDVTSLGAESGWPPRIETHGREPAVMTWSAANGRLIRAIPTGN
ncbi:MAG: hypothetical protein IRY99_09125 [Isosphaeraceae bacterium]|nr:hypothetical protein [Isosphaeraceae bacterium]